jgi:phosphoglycolate phosphatase-like HAD superfamily hydrolase
MADFLDARVYGDELPVHKPDPQPLRLALSRLGVADKPHAAYVGDAPDDMRMARTVGVRGVGIASVLGSPDELRAAGASDVAASVAAWVDQLLGPARSPAPDSTAASRP